MGLPRVRNGAVVRSAIGLSLGSLMPRPDVLIERSGRNAAARNDAGELVLAHARRSRFAAERWLLADGDASSPAQSAARPGFSCADHVCMAVVKGRRVAFAAKEAEGHFACPQAEVLIAAFPLRGACEGIGLRIDRFDVWREGAHALYFGEQGIKVETAFEARGRRPWVTKPKPRNTRANLGLGPSSQ